MCQNNIGGEVSSLEARTLQMMIEEKRKELDSLVLSNLKNLCNSKVIKLSNELDELIALYFSLSDKDIKHD